jgi:LemA protein
VRSFPTNLTAKMFNHELKANFSVESEAAIARPPAVDFGAAPAAAPTPAPAPAQ